MDEDDIGSSEKDGGSMPGETDQGDGTNLTRPNVKGDGTMDKTAEALRQLGAGKSYGCSN